MGNLIQCDHRCDEEAVHSTSRTIERDRPTHEEVFSDLRSASCQTTSISVESPGPLEEVDSSWQHQMPEVSGVAELEARIAALEKWTREFETGGAGTEKQTIEQELKSDAVSTAQESPVSPSTETMTEKTVQDIVVGQITAALQASASSLSLSDIHVADLAKERDGHEIKESCWDSFVFCGESSIGRGGSFFIVLGICLTCIGNFLFLFVLLYTKETFVQAERPEADTLRTWRYTIGHSQRNMLSTQSLVSAVCDGTQLLIQASEQAQLAQDIEAYGISNGFNSGIWLASFVILMWFLTVVNEIEEACSFAAGVRRLYNQAEEASTKPGESSSKPGQDQDGTSTIGRSSTSSNGRSRSLRLANTATEYKLHELELDRSEKITFHALSYVRITSNVLVCVVRIGFAVALFVVGALWLAHTLNIENLVLNAAALEFVMNLDELVYRAFIPDSVKALVNNADKLPSPKLSKRLHEHKVAGITLAPILRFGLTIIAVIAFLALVLIPQQAEIRTLHEVLCGGDLSFVDIDMEFFPQVAQTQGEGDEDGLVVRAAEFKIKHLEEYAKLDGAKPTWLQYKEMMQAVDAGALSLYPRKCEDHRDLRRVELRTDRVDFVDFFQAYAGHNDVATCGALKSMCGETTAFWIRFLCPQTCGCDHYRGPLWVRSGCPQTCEGNAKYLQGEDTIECKDAPRAELQKDPAWKMWWIGNWSEWYTEQWEGFTENKVPDCEILASNSDAGALPQLLCSYGKSAEFSGSLRLFCPTTCGCRNGGEGCPASCATNAVLKAINGTMSSSA